MNFEFKLKLCLWKRYFDTGFNILSYLKYVILFFGFASSDVYTTMLIAFLYGIFCFFLGWYWLNSEFYTAETEISNQYNLFVEEMREKFGSPNKRKI